MWSAPGLLEFGGGFGGGRDCLESAHVECFRIVRIWKWFWEGCGIAWKVHMWSTSGVSQEYFR